MSRMLIRVIDYDQKIFNIIDNGDNFISFNDRRAVKLLDQIERIKISTRRNVEGLPYPADQFSEEALSKELIDSGYKKESTWCPTRRFRNFYLPGITVVDNALSVFQNQDRTREIKEWGLFREIGMQHFRRICDSDSWVIQIQNRHIGRWGDDSSGIPRLVPAVRRNTIDIAIVHCDLMDPKGFNIFQTVLELFEKKIPLIVMVPSMIFDLSIAITAMRMGAESVIGEADLETFNNAILDAPIIINEQVI
jgi:hypothetical protein